MRWIFGVLFCTLFAFAWADSTPVTVRVTEVSPQKIGDIEEWFEFSISGSGVVDIANWKVKSGSSTKAFIDFADRLVLPSGIFWHEQTDTTLKLDLGEFSSVILYWTKSPVSLSNSGATIEILDVEGEILDQVTYGNTPKGTIEGREYTTIWNRHSEKDILFPLRFELDNSQYSDSKGASNFDSPVFSDDIEFVLTESSPDYDASAGNDFLEFQIRTSIESPVNLKYWEVKHNGTSLFRITSDFWVEDDAFLVVEFNNQPFSLTSVDRVHTITTDKKEGLSGGSGTIESILWSGTPWEKTEDFVCWMNETLSQTEGARVEDFIESQDWVGSCIDIQDLVQNESIARLPSLSDTNTLQDFFRHFHGSKGMVNESINHAPLAKIIVQGAKAIYKSTLNFTGDQSSDPDGTFDIVGYLWTVNGVSCPDNEDSWHWAEDCAIESIKQNPNRIYFDAVGTFAVCLEVFDALGSSGKECIDIQVLEDGIDPFGIRGGADGGTSIKSNIKAWILTEFKKSEDSVRGQEKIQFFEKYIVRDDFFDDFLEELSDEDLTELVRRLEHQETLEFLHQEVNPLPLFARDRFTPQERKRIGKNIGLIFTKD
jgi:hypothetical protein